MSSMPSDVHLLQSWPSGLRARAADTLPRHGQLQQQDAGEWQDGTDGFFRCTAWRQVADNAAQSFKKGSRVMVAGRLVQRTFETEGGERRTAIEIQVQHLAADIQYAAVEIKKAQVGDLESASDGPSAASSAEEKQSA